MDIIELSTEVCEVMKDVTVELTTEEIEQELSRRGMLPTLEELKRAIYYLVKTGVLQCDAEPRYLFIKTTIALTS